MAAFALRVSILLVGVGSLLLVSCSGVGPGGASTESRPAPSGARSGNNQNTSLSQSGPVEGTRAKESRAPAAQAPAVSPPSPPSSAEREEGDVQVLDRDPTGCTWVEAKASVTFGQDDTKHQAMAQAVTEARALAVERVLGTKIQDRFLNFQAESNLKGQVGLTENLLRVTQFGRVVMEERLGTGPIDTPGCKGCRFAAHIRACILPLPETGDKGFSVTLDLSRHRFVDGDEGLITVTSTRDAYLYIYSVDLDWNAGLLFPNEFAVDNRVKAGDTVTYPSEDLRRKGFKVQAQLPPGATVSAEMIRAVVSKTPLPKSLVDPAAKDFSKPVAATTSEVQGTGSFLHLLHKLHSSDMEWTEDAQAFTIYKK